ncbi:uncharacterized protein LOC127797401 isoform X1 [Diospyros lotus]|uniref:uncharacterized protein LOC127797401 isoform X1 n=1 Tax=Diospyros lotus TaxID=55363 RepID=UPI002250FADC|nr:uncharacterized protein LOC127797401 isoform X1 [Diospyros lotus]
MAREDSGKSLRRPSSKTPLSFKNYSNWKCKLRENCYKRVQEDRARLLWKLRLPEGKDRCLSDEEVIKSAFQDIVDDEFEKIQDSSLDGHLGILTSTPQIDDELWEYDGLQTSYQGECEEILLEMQRIFYEDLRTETTIKERGNYIQTWEDEEDEYLARAVLEHMQLNDKQERKVIWCPICKEGELQEKCFLISCTSCEFKLNRGNEVTIELLQARLAEAHAEHLDRGCRLKPKFRIETRFDLTALYIECEGCHAFEIVI